MYVNFDYWNTLLAYIRQENFELNGDLIHDARVIEKVRRFWKYASADYLNQTSIEDLVEICNTNVEIYKDYKTAFKNFYDDLFYCSDRMSVNRWFRLQNRICQMCEILYNNFMKKYSFQAYQNWDKYVLGHFEESYPYKRELDEECEKEWESILKLIIKNQFLKEKIENEN